MDAQAAAEAERPVATAQRVNLPLINSGRTDDFAGAATGHEPGNVWCPAATGIGFWAVRVFAANVSQVEDVSDLVGERPHRGVLGNGGAQNVVRVGSASVQTGDGLNKVGDNIELSNVIAIVEELNLLAAQLVGEAVISDFQVSQRREYVCAGEESWLLASTTPMPAVP